MKKLLFLSVIGLLALGTLAWASPVAWDKTGAVLQPFASSRSDEVKLSYLTATSTTATSTISFNLSILGDLKPAQNIVFPSLSSGYHLIQIETQNLVDTNGTDLDFFGATGNGFGSGGDIELDAGNGGSDGNGGGFLLFGGQGGINDGSGGNFQLGGGSGQGSGNGGNLIITSGAGGPTGNAGYAQIGAANAGVSSGNGGDLYLNAGGGGSLGGNGGTLELNGGSSSLGTLGKVSISSNSANGHNAQLDTNYLSVARLFSFPDTDGMFSVSTSTGIWADAFHATSTTMTSQFSGLMLVGTTTDFAINGLTPRMAIVDTSANLGDSTPMLWIKSLDTSGGNADIRIDSPNPDIELVENDQTSPAGKWEMAAQGGKLQLVNLRNLAGDSFTPGILISALANRDGVKMGIGTEFDSPDATLELVATSTNDVFNITSDVGHHGGTQGDLLTITYNGKLGIASTSPTSYLVLPPGTATAGTAPIKLVPGVALNAPELGAIEFNGGATTTGLSITASSTSPTRFNLAADYTPPYIGKVETPNSAAAVTANRAYLMATEVRTPVTLTKMAVYTGATSPGIDLGVYNQAGVLLGSTGSSTPTSNGSSITTLSHPVYLAPGWYYLAVANSNSVTALGRYTTDNVLGCSAINSSFPLPGTIAVPGSTSGVCPTIAGLVSGGVTQ